MAESTENKNSMAVHQRQEHYDILFKLVTLGDVNVGKTSLITHYITEKAAPPDGEANPGKPTVGIEFRSKILRKMDGRIVKA